MLVRPAQKSDIPHLINMGARFHASLPHLDSILPFDPDSFGEFVFHIIEYKTGVVLCLDDSGTLRGMACAIAIAQWFNRNHTAAQEVFWWVDEEARGHGMQLFNALESWAVERGVDSITVSSTTVHDPERLSAFYGSRGFIQTDINYIKRVQSCQPV